MDMTIKTAVLMTQKNKYERELSNIRDAETILNNILINKECYNLSMLTVNGEDLMKAGIPKGVLLGSVLNELLNLVIEEKLENNKETLMNYVRKHRKIKN